METTYTVELTAEEIQTLIEARNDQNTTPTGVDVKLGLAEMEADGEHTCTDAGELDTTCKACVLEHALVLIDEGFYTTVAGATAAILVDELAY